jgi:hypothetical protein
MVRQYNTVESALLERYIRGSESAIDPVPYTEVKPRDTEAPTISDSHVEYMKLLPLFVAAVKYANQDSKPITINNISTAQSEAVSQESVAGSMDVLSRRTTLEILSEMFQSFFSSGFNRVCFFGACGMGMYIYWSYLDHKWHMAEVQRRIDSNIMLKMSDWLFSDKPILPRTKAPSSSRLPF